MVKTAVQDATDFLESLASGGVAVNVSEGCIAPTLTGIDVKSVKKFVDLREVYDDYIGQYALLIGRDVNQIRTPWKQKVKLPLMKAWAQVTLEKPWKEVTEEEFIEELNKIKERVVYSRGDVDSIIRKKVKVDIKIADAETRILEYFALMRQVIEEEGLSDLVKPNKKKNSKYCRLIVDNLTPAALKTDIKNHLEYDEFRVCKRTVSELYQLVVKRAVKQQKRHDYALRNGYKYVGSNEDKPEIKKRIRDNDDSGGHKKKFKKVKKQGDKKEDKTPDLTSEQAAKLKCHMSGCLACGESHNLNDHVPKLSAAEKKHLWNTYNKEKGIKPGGHRRALLQYLAGHRSDLDEGIDQDIEGPKFKVLINGVLELPALADSGARYLPAMSREHVEKLKVLDPAVEITRLKKPIVSEQPVDMQFMPMKW